MNGIRIEQELSPDRATQDTIEQGLDRHNEARVGADPATPVWHVARDLDDAVVGGLRGVRLWGWFLIDWLWVAETMRGNGLGRRLLEQAEQTARKLGCTGMFLNSFSFQAPGFYIRQGFVEFGRLEDFPAGHSRIWLRKTLA